MARTCEMIRDRGQNDNTFGSRLPNHWHSFNKGYFQHHPWSKTLSSADTKWIQPNTCSTVWVYIKRSQSVVGAVCICFVNVVISINPVFPKIWCWFHLLMITTLPPSCLTYNETPDSRPLSLIWTVLVGLNLSFLCNCYECMKYIKPLLALHLGPSQAQPEGDMWISHLMGQPPM